MDRKSWIKKIKTATETVGSYQPSFDDVIDTLAQILETRDITYQKWVEEGCEPVIIHTNKAGESNPTKNPLLMMVNDLNTQALAYWRELCLTPKGLKALTDEVIEKTKEDGLEKILSKLNVK